MNSQESSLHSIVLMVPQPHSSANDDGERCSVYTHRLSRMERGEKCKGHVLRSTNVGITDCSNATWLAEQGLVDLHETL